MLRRKTTIALLPMLLVATLAMGAVTISYQFQQDFTAADVNAVAEYYNYPETLTYANGVVYDNPQTKREHIIAYRKADFLKDIIRARKVAAYEKLNAGETVQLNKTLDY